MARPVVDIAGQRFGRLTVVALAGLGGNGKHARWTCRCDCGGETCVAGQHLRRGNVRSCGCLAREVGERNRDVATKHGMVGTVEYQAWRNMISRCEQPSSHGFANYGGRGIVVCSEWRHDFAAFYAHIGPRPSPRHSVDRIDNEGDYEPGNVRWATRVVQNNNQRRRVPAK